MSDAALTKTATGAARSTLLATKVHPPVPRANLVPRGRLLDRLAYKPDRRLTVLTAPAGWGKTTLALEWRRREARSRAFAWVTLDPEDSDPMRFWTCVVQAIDTASPAVVAEAARLLALPRPDLAGAVLPALVNALDGAVPPVVLVLDDFHLVRSGEVDDQLTYLVGHAPPALHVAVLSRYRSRLPVARLRAQGALTEIDATDLRFSPAETRTLLVEVLGLRLAADDVRELQQRTEGWAAALHLAALSLLLRGGDHGAAIRRFTGRDQHLVEYLAAEVLHGLDPDLRDFLARTAVLRRMSAPLCDAVTGRDDSSRMLAAIETRNLLVVPLDDERRWLRYHHLFADMLRHELSSLPPGEVAELHRRAARWHDEQGSASEAVRHALEAGDRDFAHRVVARHWNSNYNRGRLATVSAWLDALGDDVRRDPWLSAARVLVWADEGRLDELDAWLEVDGERVVDGYPYAIMRALHRFKSGDLGRARHDLEIARELRTETHPFWPTVEHCVAGVVAYWLGDLDHARSQLATAMTIATSYGNLAGHTYALGYLALIAVEDGDLLVAGRRLVQLSPQVSRGADLEAHFVAALPHLASGLLAIATGHDREADADLTRAVEVARRGAGRLELIATLAARGRALGREGDRAASLAVLGEAAALLARCSDPGRAAALVADQPGVIRVPAPRGGVMLTAREAAVLRLLPSGLSLREIADDLFVSHNTVKTQSRSLYRKLSASTREEAVRLARSHGLL